MKGIHDLGGKSGFGEVDRADSDVVFHDRWEASVFAMLGAGFASGAWSNADRFRHAIERIEPEAYLHHGYYGRWLGGIETLLVEAGVVSQADITSRAMALGAQTGDLVAARPSASPDPAGEGPRSGGSIRSSDTPPKFGPGDTVRSIRQTTEHHTRLPEYAEDKPGVIVAHHDAWVFPDTNAHGKGENPRHLYTVKFSSEVLWGRPGFTVCLDLFEPYLREESLEVSGVKGKSAGDSRGSA